MDMTLAAPEVYRAPAERVVIDWYDGIVQAVLLHDVHGAWYVFAVGAPSARERELCMRPLVDRSVLPELDDLETLDEEGWIERFGAERVLPACGPGGVLLRVSGGEVLEVRAMSDDEVASARPVGVGGLTR